MEILNSYTQFSGWGDLFIFFGVIGTILTALWVVYAFTDSYRRLVRIISSCALLLSISFFFIAFQLPENTFHEVIINDIDSFDYDRYEITEQNGKIFTVKEIGE